MGLSLLELESVSTAARLGSLSRTAEALNVTQPALSRRIAEAEQSLGVILFERFSRGVRPTEACLAFLRHAELAMANIDDGREAARSVHHRRAHEVTIALHEIFCDERTIAVCKEALSTHGLAGIDFKVCEFSSEVSDHLLIGQAKLGLRYRRDNNPHLQCTWVAEDALVVACAASHPLAAGGGATREQLEQEKWIGHPYPVDRTNSSLEDGLKARGFQGWRTMQITKAFPLLRLLEAGFGLALVRRACISRQLDDGSLVELDTPLSFSIPIFLAWRRGSFLGDATEAVRSALVAAYQLSPAEDRQAIS